MKKQVQRGDVTFQGHTATDWQGRRSNPDLLDSKAAVSASPINRPLLPSPLPFGTLTLARPSLAHTVSKSHILWQTSVGASGKWMTRWVVSISLHLSIHGYPALS